MHRLRTQRRTKSRRKPPDVKPEARLRARCRMYLANALPEPGWYSSLEHGRVHHGTPEQRAREWTKLAAQGVKQGLPDIAIWHCGKFIGIELKALKNKPTEAQVAFAAAMAANQFFAFTIRSVVELHDCLLECGVPVVPSMRIEAMRHDAQLSVPEVKKPRATGKPRAPKPTRGALNVMARARGKGIFG